MFAAKSESSTFDESQFRLWFQPVYNTTNGNILHHEVLLRWLDPKGCVFLPCNFLPKVASLEMLLWLDYLVIKKAVGLLAKQSKLRLSINLSKDVLSSYNTVKYVQDLLKKYQIAPQRLSFELTEEVIAQHFSDAVVLIQSLKALGCLVTLDTFQGSTLTIKQLRTLPIDLIKIDSRFVHNPKNECFNQNLLQPVVEMAQKSGQILIAKFFPHGIDPKVFYKKGIFHAQGFYLKSPSSQINSANLVYILGFFVDSIKKTKLLEQLKEGLVVTPNVDHLMKLKDDQEFLAIYSSADYKICDSKVLFYASKFLGTPIKETIPGSDFFPEFCDHHKNNHDIKVFLLGGEEQALATKAQLNINEKVGRMIVVSAYSPPFGFERDEAESLKIIQMVNQSGATVLAVGVGAPKQEKWIVRHRDQLPNVKIFLAIGATINYMSGSLKRSPVWMRKLSCEWLFRLFTDPKRLWRRYLVDDLPFLGLILKQKLRS
jgi:exopolysaccharide biosynthesis WecB/TagA/CpsF family protein